MIELCIRKFLWKVVKLKKLLIIMDRFAFWEKASLTKYIFLTKEEYAFKILFTYHSETPNL